MNSRTNLIRPLRARTLLALLVFGCGMLALPLTGRAGVQAYIQYIDANNGSGITLPHGDSTNTNFPAAQGWFQLPAMSVDVSQAVTLSSGGGAGSGKVTFNALNIQKLVDAMSPALFKYLAAGNTFDFVNIVFTRTGVDGNPFPFFKISLGLVAAQTQGFSLPANGNDLTENVSFQYGAMALYFTSQNPDGSAGPTIKQGWDRIKNVTWNGVVAP